VAYITAGRYLAAAGMGCIELVTEYSDDKSDKQQCTIRSIEDPAMVGFDPNARRLDRSDAQWCYKLKQYTREEYESTFGKGHVVLKDRMAQSALGWLSDAIGMETNYSQINEWTGQGKGPYLVVEFYHLDTDPVKLFNCSDHINRYADEDLPRGVKQLDLLRTVERRTITKYLVDAFEVLDETEWLGTITPLIPVLGQEVWIDGKLHRLSLISEALDSQRALNYTATTATELAGLMPKSPWIGWKGQFADERWQSANSEVWAYLEIEPIHAIDPVTGESSLLPAPQRNAWETPFEPLLSLAAFFEQSIKATTSIYQESLGESKPDQSGRAIEQLRSESSSGTFFIADNLHHAIRCLYEQIVIVNCQIKTKASVETIVRPDSQHELATINQDFPDGIDPASGKQAKAKWLAQGRYAVAVTVGPNYDTIKQQTSAILTDFLKIDPQIMAVPGVAAKALRSISQGDPEIEGIADLLEPNQQSNPQQLAQQLQQEQQKTKVLMGVVQKLHQDAQAQLPKIDADKWKAAVSALAGIREAEIKAGVDNAQMDASFLEHLTGMAHDSALKHMDHEQADKQQAQQQAHDSGMADQQTANTMATNQQQADLAPEPQETNGD
jgi:hypothetical protein